MAVLGLDEVLRRVKEEGLLENLGDRDLNNPEGAGLDLRLGILSRMTEGGAFIESDGPEGLGKRKGVQTEVVAEYKPGAKTQEEVVIKPGEYYFVTTIESFNASEDLLFVLYPRTTLMRMGLLLLANRGDPGYKGTVSMGLVNLSKFDVKLQMGARVCNVVFYKVEGETVMYRGQHGGRITPTEVEQQV